MSEFLRKMSVLNILCYPDPFLKTTAEPVVNFDKELEQIINDMVETLYQNPAIGLAAVQVDIDKRIFVMDVSYNREDPESKKETHIIINPEIVKTEGSTIYEEGCLSIPEYRAEVQRAENLVLKYQDINQNPQELKAEGLLAICIQHEFDHLNGKLFIDHLAPLKRKMIQNKLKKQALRDS